MDLFKEKYGAKNRMGKIQTEQNIVKVKVVPEGLGQGQGHTDREVDFCSLSLLAQETQSLFLLLSLPQWKGDWGRWHICRRGLGPVTSPLGPLLTRSDLSVAACPATPLHIYNGTQGGGRVLRTFWLLRQLSPKVPPRIRKPACRATLF